MRRMHIYNNSKFSKPLNEFSPDNIGYRTFYNSNKYNFGLSPEIELSIRFSTGQIFTHFANLKENLQLIIYKCLEDNKLINYKNRIGAILFEGRALVLNKTLSENKIINNSKIVVLINNIEEESKTSNFGKSLKYSFSSSAILTENPDGKMDNRKQNFFERENTKLCNGINECVHIHNNKHRHGLVLLYTNSDYNCKICKKSFMKKIATYFCSLCKFDICSKCIGNGRSILNKFYNEQNLLESYKFPCHEHEMIYCKISSKNKNMNKTYTCDLCLRSYNHSTWSFYCTNCNYYICLSCSKKYIPANKFINIGIKINAHNHKLVYMVTQRNWTCKLCQKSYNKFCPTYYCSKCNYDVCEKCMKKRDKFVKLASFDLSTLFTSFSIENPKNNIINDDCHNHPLIYCNTHGLNNKEKWICNKCSKSYKNDWSFYCTWCNFYLCYDCYINSI